MQIVQSLTDSFLIVILGMVYTRWILFVGVVFTLIMTELIVSIGESDMIGIFAVVAIVLGMPHMMYEANKYKGLTQSASLWHWQSFLIWIMYALYRLLVPIGNTKSKYDSSSNNSSGFDFNSRISFENTPILFVVTVLLISVLVLNNIFDFVAIYKWYIAKNRVIIRPDYILKRYHQRKEILDKKKNEEWIMKNGVVIR